MSAIKMTKKKPDRFERIVEECHFNERSDARDAVDLLRKEHREVVRMVAAEIENWHESGVLSAREDTSRIRDEIVLALQDILVQLKKRAT